MTKNNIEISIIIATFNADKHLQSCIDSIVSQKIEFIELIIIDGNSTDQTLAIINNNQDCIDYWVSEPDQGIYDAWNKGISIANGNWVMFLGADDRLKTNAIKTYLDYIETEDVENADIISSRVHMMDVNGKVIRIKGWMFEWPRFLKEMTIAHPGALHSKCFFKKYGKFNSDYKIVGDYELLLRAGSQLKAKFINCETVEMLEGGMSDSYAAIREQYRAVLEFEYQNKVFSIVNFLCVVFKLFVKRSLRRLGINAYLRRS